MKLQKIFISSVQKEFADERAALRDFLRGDPLLRRFFDPFLFEDLPAADHRADEVYVDEVERCDLYLGLFGNEYGFEDAQGLSPTEREFAVATQRHKHRLIFIKGADDQQRHPKMQALIRRAGEQLIRRRFATKAELIAGVYAALVQYLEDRNLIRTEPFDAATCPDATLDDLSADQIRDFVVKNFLFGDGSKLTATTPFLETGIVDSTGLLEVIEFLETTFAITIEDHELLPANLNSIENIVRFVGEKKKQCAA